MLSIAELKRHLENGHFDKHLCLIHSRASLDKSRKRLHTLFERMEKSFNPVEAGIASAPGRTELGGNHTDHNHGHVLAAAVNLDCLAVFSPSSDPDKISVLSENYNRLIEVDITDTSPRAEEEGSSEGIVRGIADGFRNCGFSLSGFNACVSSTIPAGTGLSSSAAFGVLMGRIFNCLFNNNRIGPLDIARIAKDAENIHFGKPCGFMDQMASSFEGILSIDFRDPLNPLIDTILPGFEFQNSSEGFYGTGYHLCVVDTGGNHADLTPDYAAIPEEMFRAAEALGRNEARGLEMNDVLKHISSMREKVSDRAILRLMHFIGENERAVRQAEALKNGDMPELLRLIKESGQSSSQLLQNCFSPADPATQPIPLAIQLTELMFGDLGVARIHGGGFAGTIQAYIHESRFENYKIFMENIFGAGSVIELKLRQPGREFLCINDVSRDGS